jgi:hypothetical protein
VNRHVKPFYQEKRVGVFSNQNKTPTQNTSKIKTIRVLIVFGLGFVLVCFGLI